ncbi:hypothetical protein BG618_02857 [Pseudonocardia autotrophica]|nr:hypothetical protein BG618_02857 [Pseudonocardia autotrophica]
MTVCRSCLNEVTVAIADVGDPPVQILIARGKGRFSP